MANPDTTDDCLICNLEGTDPSAIVFRDELWDAQVVSGFDVPGWFFLRTRRHAERLTGLNGAELSSLGHRACDLVAAVTEATGAPATYLFVFGENYPHFHAVITARGDHIPEDRRSGDILKLRAEHADPVAAARMVPAVREAYQRIAGTDSAASSHGGAHMSTTTSTAVPSRDRPVIPPKLHHSTFLTLKLDEMVAWYRQVTGLTPVHYAPGEAAWLTNDEANHRIALVTHPETKAPVDKPTSAGLHHTAFEYATFDQWVDNYSRLKQQGIVPFMCLDHGITMSMYYADPEGNGVEIQFDNFGDWSKSKEWMWASLEFASNPIGSWFDPDKIVAARDEGLAMSEIHERARAGKYAPEHPRESILLPEVYY